MRVNSRHCDGVECMRPRAPSKATRDSERKKGFFHALLLLSNPLARTMMVEFG